jgi:hypothetical protein
MEGGAADHPLSSALPSIAGAEIPSPKLGEG